MVAYSFKRRFRAPILSGTKCQTIRANRKRHARPSEQVQLYTGMRTRECQIIGKATCLIATPIRIDLDFGRVEVPAISLDLVMPPDLDAFARLDGFEDWLLMRDFLRTEHPRKDVFSGILIRWAEFAPSRSP